MVIRVKQIYYCVNAGCGFFKKRIESWLTPADASHMLGALRCGVCNQPLKWMRTEKIGQR